VACAIVESNSIMILITISSKGFEQVDKDIIARLDSPGRLIHSDVTTICRWELKKGTYSK
jgi:hypothetical protein